MAALAFVIVIGAWAYRDAEARGARGWAVALLVIATCPIGLFVWMLARPACPATFDLERFRVE